MLQGVVDTPRTNVGDATYLQAQDFDITQEQSFQSPSKDHINILHQMGAGRRAGGGGISLKTPRTRMPFGDRTNNRGAEFTPLLKSATRNSAMMFGNGKENNGMPRTPAFLKPGGLDRVLEDVGQLTPVPDGASMYEEDSQGNSYVNGTPIPRIDSSSLQDTPIQPVARRNGGPDVLSDGNQLSLREQENVIDKIEKENFGLKLKIHFLEEALRKAGPGFSEAALKENTELKVEKVQMQKELHRYRKTASAAEKDVETHRQQIAQLERQSRGGASNEELDQLRDALHERESEIKDLYHKLDEGDAQLEQMNKLRDSVTDLEHDLREKDRQVDEREDKIDNLKQQVNERDDEIVELEEAMKEAKKREASLNPQQWEDEIDSARETISELQADVKKLRHELEEAKEEQQEAVAEKERAISDLEELQDELANKSITTKGLSRQIEDKMNRLQDDLEDLQENHKVLQQDRQEKIQAIERLQQRITELDQSAGAREKALCADLEEAIRERDDAEQQAQSSSGAAEMLEKYKAEVTRLQNELGQTIQQRDQAQQAAQGERNASQQVTQLQAQVNALRLHLEDAIKDRDLAETQNQAIGQQLDEFEHALRNKSDEKELLQIRHDALSSESSSLQKELQRMKESIDDLRHQLDHEKTQSLQAEREVREQYKAEIDRLHDELEDLRAEAREKERLYDDDAERWEKETRSLDSQRLAAEDQAASLKRTIEKLQAVEGSLSGKEARLQEALNLEKARHAQAESQLNNQISSLNNDLLDRQRQLEDVKNELVKLREELRLSQREERGLIEKIEGLEDEIDVLQAEANDDRANAEQKIRQLEQQADDLGRQIENYKHQLESASSRPTQSFVGQEDSQLRRVEADLERVTKSEFRLKEQLIRLEDDILAAKVQTGDVQLERDQLKSQLHALENANFNASIRAPSHNLNDDEKIELRTQKMRLDLEVRKLHDNLSSLQEQKATLEAELRVTREAMEDERLSYKEKDLEYLKKDVTHRETVRDLKRQIDELERQAHNLEISLLQTSSPHSSLSSSGRKNEVVEVRAQLAKAHETIKDLRNQLREAEKEASKKTKELTNEIQNKEDEWEADRFELERSIQTLARDKSEFESKNDTAESSIGRLKSKILRLEDELKVERESRGEERTLALERHDLHEMLRDTQIELEQLQIDCKSRDSTIQKLSNAEHDLKNQLKRIRDERTQERNRADDAMAALERLESDFQAAEREWEEERNSLTRGVRFPNMSISELKEEEKLAIRQELESKEKKHAKELRGLAMQVEWLRARCKREEGLRSDAAWAKRFMLLQVELFGACNQADLQLLQQMGITPDTTIPFTRPSLKRVGLAVLAAIRMKRGAEQWAKSRKIHDKLAGKVAEMRRASNVDDSQYRTPKRISSRREEPRSEHRNLSMSGGLGAIGRKSLQDTLASVANAKRVAELIGEGRRKF